MNDKIRDCFCRISMFYLAGLMVLTAGTAGAWDSGGPLLPEQAAYDVTFYDLALTVDPDSKTIEGVLTVEADLVEPLRWFVLDLDDSLEVLRIVRLHEDGSGQELFFERRELHIWSDLGAVLSIGDNLRIAVTYGGTPHEALNAPWEGGFVWDHVTINGAPWVGVACQNDGADLWWPCKDHPSDEPDSMALHFTVPTSLVCASNGRLRAVEDHGDGTKTWHWFSSTPINTYNVTLNLATYRIFEDSMALANGDTLPIQLYLLSRYAAKGPNFLKQMKKIITFLEMLYGPYPFWIDKFGIAQTPYVGMEHQTIIAYGAAFQYNDFGFDYILFHETTHEWWGNMVTNSDWKDMWLHEGFTSYTEALYAEYLKGKASLHEYVAQKFAIIENKKPLAPYEPTSIDSIYSGDVYNKGARVLHSLRYLLGDDLFFQALRRMLYPTPGSESIKTGAQCRITDSEAFIETCEQVSGQELGWFFDVYLRQTGLPELISRVENDTLKMTWISESGGIFPMPLDVKIGEDTLRVMMPDGSGGIKLNHQNFEIDPLNWVLKTAAEPSVIDLEAEGPGDFILFSAFPNPFNPVTTCSFELETRQHVKVNVYDSRGRLAERLLDETLDAGRHRVSWNAGGRVSGVYIIHAAAAGRAKNCKVVLMK